jgi:hypothetical protein
MPACTPTPEPRSLTHHEAEALIAGAQSHRLGVMLTTMVIVGLRPGEATGLLWSDLDLDAGTLSVTGSMKRTPRQKGSGYDLIRGPVKKSRAGRRTIQLPASLLPLLRAHRCAQAAERLAAGPLWVDQGLVFASDWHSVGSLERPKGGHGRGCLGRDRRDRQSLHRPSYRSLLASRRRRGFGPSGRPPRRSSAHRAPALPPPRPARRHHRRRHAP